jgi:hypothetical protein
VPWFRLDEGFHSHPKVLRAGNEAIGLYVRCGTYAAEHLTDGFIPEQVALQYGTPALAATLVETKLWRRARGGWRMPDYLDYNPSKEAVDKERKQAAERQRRRREHLMSQRDSQRDSQPSVPVRPGLDPVVDVVSRSNGSSRASTAVIDAIIKELHDQTGTLIDPDWASLVAAELLRGQQVTNPAAYVRTCIRNDPNPSARFLPHAVYGRHAKDNP